MGSNFLSCLLALLLLVYIVKHSALPINDQGRLQEELTLLADEIRDMAVANIDADKTKTDMEMNDFSRKRQGKERWICAKKEGDVCVKRIRAGFWFRN